MSAGNTDGRGRTLILGIDSGGTKSEALLTDAAGHVLGHGICDFMHPESGRGPGGSGRTARTVLRAVAAALDGAPQSGVSAVYVAGRGSLPHDWAPEPLQAVASFYPVREPDSSLALAGTVAGIVVLAGTGAFVYGRTEDGRELHLDSLGPLLGDAGSAFEIGLRAVRAVARASWHERHRTTLVEPILAACRSYAGSPHHFSLVDYMLQCRDRSEIASLARIVSEHAEHGDAVAQRILEQAADSLADTLRDVVDCLGMAQTDLPLIAAGSVARRSKIYWARVCQRAAEIAPHLRPIVPEHREVVGIVLAASRRMANLAPDFEQTLRQQTMSLDGGGQ